MSQDISASQQWGNVIAREQLLSSARQEKQLQHLNAQLGELRALQQQQLQAQLAAQQQQQWQALLQQVLYETEETAKALGSLAATNPFVAGVRARLWLRSIMEAGMHPNHFTAVEHKRSLTEAGRMLEAIAQADATNSGDLVDRVVTAWRRHDELRARVGDTTDARLQSMTESMQEANDAATKLGSRVGVGIGLALLGVVGFIAGFVLLSHNASLPEVERSSSPFVAFIIGMGFCAVGLGLRSSANMRITQLRQEAGEANIAASAMRSNLAAYKAFCADENGGKLLERIFAEHPGLAGR